MTRAPRKKPMEDDFDGEDLTAAEYALGVLNSEERAVVEARAETDAAFAEEILHWVMRFSPLMELVDPEEPSVALWGRIQAVVSRSRPRVETPPQLSLEPQPEPTLATAPPAANDEAPRRSPGLWRTWAVGASAIAAAAILFIGVRLVAPGVLPATAPLGHGPTLVARLSLTQSGAGVVTVAYDAQRSTLYAAPDADFSIPKARAAELWLIPADGKPRPMGVIDASKPATMPMPPQFRSLAQADAKLALSIEPEGGSPTGAPTGPVIAAGGFQQI